MKRFIILSTLFLALISCYGQNDYERDGHGNYIKRDDNGNITVKKSRVEFVEDSTRSELIKKEDEDWFTYLSSGPHEDFDKRFSERRNLEKNRERVNDSLQMDRELKHKKQAAKEQIARANAKAAEKAKQYQQNQELEERLRLAKEEKERKQQERKKRIVETYGQEIANKINNRQVSIGWTKTLCLESWGKPYSINKTTTANGVHEQWVYNLKRYLYFDGDILTAIQE